MSIDNTLRLLTHHRRRTVLKALIETDEDVIPLSRLVGTVARREEESDRRSIERDLHHRHLPRLASAGVVVYDRQNGTVRYQRTHTVEELLEWTSLHGG